jgi:hypothetical protein
LSGAADSLAHRNDLIIDPIVRVISDRCIAAAPIQMNEADFAAAYAAGQAISLKQAIAETLDR